MWLGGRCGEGSGCGRGRVGGTCEEGKWVCEEENGRCVERGSGRGGEMCGGEVGVGEENGRCVEGNWVWWGEWEVWRGKVGVV